MTTFSCGGNRRKELKQIYTDIKGIAWVGGAVGNSKYGGFLVKDLLIDSGFNLEEIKGKHLIAVGADTDFQGVAYQVSIPIKDILDDRNEIMLAYEMNGKPIPIDHGFPLRLITPGYIGVRSAKWVT